MQPWCYHHLNGLFKQIPFFREFPNLLDEILLAEDEIVIPLLVELIASAHHLHCCQETVQIVRVLQPFDGSYPMLHGLFE